MKTKTNFFSLALILSLLLICFTTVSSVHGNSSERLTPLTPTDTEGVLVFQAEHTNSPLGNWEIISPGHPRFFPGASNDVMLYFTGNAPNLGPPDSPIKYTFKAPESGTYQLTIRSSRILEGARNDHCNDYFVRMEGDFEPGEFGSHDTFSKSILESDTKHYFSSVPDREWGWTVLGERRIDGENVKKRLFYNLKKDEVYTLTVSGRSKRAIMDYIVLFDTSKVSMADVRDGEVKLMLEPRADGSSSDD